MINVQQFCSLINLKYSVGPGMRPLLLYNYTSDWTYLPVEEGLQQWLLPGSALLETCWRYFIYSLE